MGRLGFLRSSVLTSLTFGPGRRQKARTQFVSSQTVKLDGNTLWLSMGDKKQRKLDDFMNVGFKPKYTVHRGKGKVATMDVVAFAPREEVALPTLPCFVEGCVAHFKSNQGRSSHMSSCHGSIHGSTAWAMALSKMAAAPSGLGQHSTMAHLYINGRRFFTLQAFHNQVSRTIEQCHGQYVDQLVEATAAQHIGGSGGGSGR